MPLTLAGPISGNARWKPERLRLELHPVLQVLERLQGEVQEVARAALSGIRGAHGSVPYAPR